MKKVIIVGHQGQDGKFLWDLCKKKKFSIIGVGRKRVDCHNIKYNNLVDIKKLSHVQDLIINIKPDYLFFVAAYHHSSEDTLDGPKELYQKSYVIHCTSYMNFLECVANYSIHTRIFYASSSHIYGDISSSKSISESFPWNPVSIYGITKLNGMHVGNYYRKFKSIFVSNGILFGHESVHRKQLFVSKKIVSTAVKIYYGEATKLVVGNLNTLVDWGYAGDFAAAYLKILESENPDNFIVATGKLNKINKFVELVFNELGLVWEKYVIENNKIINRSSNHISGDFTKLKQITGWQPIFNIESLAKKMVKDEIELFNN